MPRIIEFFLLVFLVVGGFAAQNRPLSPDTIIESYDASSSRLLEFLGSESKRALGANVFYEQLHRDDSAKGIFPNALAALSNNLISLQKELDLGVVVLGSDSKLLEASLSNARIDPSFDSVESLMVNGLGLIANEEVDRVKSIATHLLTNEVRLSLKAHLLAYRRNNGDSAYEVLTRSTTKDTFRASLTAGTHSLLNGRMDTLSDGDKILIDAIYSKEIDALLKTGFQGFGGLSESSTADLEQNSSNILGLAKAFVKFADKTGDQFERISSAQRGLAESLALATKLIKGDRAAEDLQELLFSNIPASEHLRKLKRKLSAAISPEESIALQARIDLVDKHFQMVDNVSGFLNGASELVGIARELGVNPNLIATMQTGITAGETALNAFQSFASGNILGGISALGSLFGITGRDIAAQRHEQIMNALGGIQTEVKIIGVKVDLLLRGQEQILKNQQIIYESITKLGAQLEEVHQAIQVKLLELQGDILVNRQLINSRVEEEIALCSQLPSRPEFAKSSYDLQRRLFFSYSDFVELHAALSVPFNECSIRLQKTRVRGNRFHSFFWLETYKDLTNNIGLYLTNVYLPALQFFGDCAKKDPHGSAAVYSLLAPMADTSGLNAKLKNLKSIATPQPGISLFEQIRIPLSVSAVVEQTKYMLQYHLFYLLVDPYEKRPYSLETLAKSERVSNKSGLLGLKEALALVDATIAQQSMVSGDILLRFMSEIFTRQNQSPTPEDQALFLRARDLMKNNSVLAKNFLIFQFREEILKEHSVLSYALGLSSRTPVMLNQITKSKWQFHRSETARSEIEPWFVEIAGKLIPLPSADEVQSGHLTYTSEIQELLRLRSELCSEIASYDALNFASPELRRAVKHAVLNLL